MNVWSHRNTKKGRKLRKNTFAQTRNFGFFWLMKQRFETMHWTLSKKSLWNLVCGSGVRTGGGGVRGSTPPPIEDFKRNENLSFWNEPPFSYRDCRNCSDVFPCYPTCYKISKNFHCDAIIGLPVVTFSGALRLTLTIAEKVKSFFFETNRFFFVRSLPKLLSCFSVRSNFLIQFRETFITMRSNNTGIPTFLMCFAWTVFLSLMLLWSNWQAGAFLNTVYLQQLWPHTKFFF